MIKITHDAGFFSCCSVKLLDIKNYFQKQGKLPLKVDSSESFRKYKINRKDITFDFFEHYNNINIDLEYEKYKNIIFQHQQFHDYKKIDYNLVTPFIKKYFTPSKNIENIVNNLLLKYNIDVDNCVSLYYRGTDKIRETKIDSFDSYYQKLNEIINKNKNLQILIQTDSAPFLDYIKKRINNIIVINENSVSYKNKGIHNEKKKYENYNDMKNLFSTFLIISKCKYFICSSGNCSIWMMYYRQNINNVHQNLNKVWL